MKLHVSARGPESCRRFTPVLSGLIYDSILRYAIASARSLFSVHSGDINRQNTFLVHGVPDEGDEHGHRNTV